VTLSISGRQATPQAIGGGGAVKKVGAKCKASHSLSHWGGGGPAEKVGAKCAPPGQACAFLLTFPFLQHVHVFKCIKCALAKKLACVV